MPTVAPAGRPAMEAVWEEVTSASAGDSLFAMAATMRPCAMAVGKSFRLCTAISAWPLRMAFSTSEVKKPIDSDL